MTLCALLTEARTTLDAIMAALPAKLPGCAVAVEVVPENPGTVEWAKRTDARRARSYPLRRTALASIGINLPVEGHASPLHLTLDLCNQGDKYLVARVGYRGTPLTVRRGIAPIIDATVRAVEGMREGWRQRNANQANVIAGERALIARDFVARNHPCGVAADPCPIMPGKFVVRVTVDAAGLDRILAAVQGA